MLTSFQPWATPQPIFLSCLINILNPTSLRSQALTGKNPWVPCDIPSSTGVWSLPPCAAEVELPPLLLPLPRVANGASNHGFAAGCTFNGGREVDVVSFVEGEGLRIKDLEGFTYMIDILMYIGLHIAWCSTAICKHTKKLFLIIVRYKYEYLEAKFLAAFAANLRSNWILTFWSANVNQQNQSDMFFRWQVATLNSNFDWWRYRWMVVIGKYKCIHSTL